MSLDKDDVLKENKAEINKAVYKWYRGNTNLYDKEDLEQEAALAAIKACSTFDESKGSRGGFVYSSASREVMKYRQENTYHLNVSRSIQAGEKIHKGFALSTDVAASNTNEGDTLGDLIPSSGEAPLDNMIRNEENEIFSKYLNSLKPIEQAVIIRHKINGEKMKNLSDEFNISVSNLYAVERKAIEKLKEKIGHFI